MQSQPNILWLTLESVRADHTPFYGYERNTTPNLQELSRRDDATVLHNGITASNWTRPSTASILTGTHYSTHNTGGRGARGTKLPDALHTLPEQLSAAGYQTALFSPAPQISNDTGLDRGFQHYVQIGLDPADFLPHSPETTDSWVCLFHHFLQEPTLDPRKLKRTVGDDTNYLQKRKVRRWADDIESTNQPFFAYAHIWSPHQPFQPIREFREAFSDEIEYGCNEAYDLAREEYTNLTTKIANNHSFSQSEWEAIKAMYDSEILYADQTLGEIVDIFEAVSNRDLVIVVTADHGELFGEHGVISHKITLHDGVTRVPMVVVGIEGIADGPEKMTQHIDLTYTLAELTDTMTDQFEGRDIRDPNRPYAISQRREWEFSDYTDINPDFDHSRYIKEPHTAVRTDDYKYLQSDSQQILYELPDESENAIDDYPSVAEEMSAIIDSEGIEWDELFEENAATFDEATRKQLEDLGYLA